MSPQKPASAYERKWCIKPPPAERFPQAGQKKMDNQFIHQMYVI